MSTPRAITITFANVPDQLHTEILSHEVKSRAITNLLNELVQLRLDRASSDALQAETDQEDRVRALELDLAGAQGSIEGLRAAQEIANNDNAKLRQHIQSGQERLLVLEQENTEKLDKSQKALSHAIELINYLYKG